MKKTISLGSRKAWALVLILALGLAAKVAKAEFTFGEPTNLGPPINSSSMDFDTTISPDGLSLYFGSERPGGSGGKDLWVTMRATVSDPWGQPVNLGPTVNSSAWDSCPSISADGLSMYFESNRPGGVGDQDIWVTSRPTPDGDWGPPVNLGSTVNSSAWDSCPSISSDGLALYFCSYRPGGYGSNDLWVTTRETVSDPWGQPINLGPTVNSSTWEYHPDISPDGLILFFFSNRPGGSGDDDLWLTTRASTSHPWTEAVNLGPTINSSARDVCAYISADGCTLYFTSQRPGGMGNDDLWQAPIIPIVDFNGDGFVDISDLLIMIDKWGTNETICDIGPMPWGDGVVDREDLEVLMGYWGQPVDDPTLIAYWKLDEIEGDIAYDSVGENDGTLYGEPLWQPDGGKVYGALEFDGVDDYISTPLVLDTVVRPFSVFAWVKGGMPGQVIFSQKGRSDWLLADPADGNLTTKLRFLTKPDRTLKSETVITDGDWHRVGLVWDGSNRILYVDDVEVASDTYEKGMLLGELQIGAGMKLEAGSFWSGLIDDVRIYNRAVSP